MCGVIVVDAGRSRSTCHRRDAYVMIISLVIVIIIRSSINCSTVICSPIVIFAILREATSETYGPWVSFHHISSLLHHTSFRSTILQSFTFRSINQKTQKYLLYLLFSFIYLYQISPLQLTVKRMTTSLSRWVQVFDCLCRCIDWGLACTSYWIDTLVL